MHVIAEEGNPESAMRALPSIASVACLVNFDYGEKLTISLPRERQVLDEAMLVHGTGSC